MTDDVRLAVPRFPQAFSDDDWPHGALLDGHGPEYWSGRACGMACVRMVFAHFGRPVPSLFALLAEELAGNAFSARGWVHAGLADLARRHGLAVHARALELGEVGRASGPVVVRRALVPDWVPTAGTSCSSSVGSARTVSRTSRSGTPRRGAPSARSSP